jgi:4,5-DOPA dioxygenase extradiol
MAANTWSFIKGNPEKGNLMPAVFVGHGSPMNAISDNEFSEAWKQLGKALPKPDAILCISAHWETMGTFVTAMDKPRTIHDFGGFPDELFQVQYPAPGGQWLAQETKKALIKFAAGLDSDWGLDHGCWSVLRKMYPDAELPVVQLSLDYSKQGSEHYAIGRELAVLRRQNVLVIGSGNMVHNLRRITFTDDGYMDLRPFGLDWALQANALFKELIDEKRHEQLANYQDLGEAVRLAVPTPEHFLPMLYTLALQQEGEKVSYFNDKPVGGSLTMTSFVIS